MFICHSATLCFSFVLLNSCYFPLFHSFSSSLFAYRFASVALFLSVISLLVTVSRMVMNVSLLVVTVHYDVSGIIMTMVRLVVTFVVLVVTVSYDGDSVSSGSDNMSTCRRFTSSATSLEFDSREWIIIWGLPASDQVYKYKKSLKKKIMFVIPISWQSRCDTQTAGNTLKD